MINYDELKKKAIRHMGIGIETIIYSKDIDKKFKSSLVSMNDVAEYLESIGAVEYEELETNGWQWDAWLRYKLNDVVYCISACGYYGGITFGIDRDWYNREGTI